MRTGAYRTGLALAAGVLLAACVNTTERYESYTASLLAKGKMRTDVEPEDAPFTQEDLARNFIKIAMYSEFNDELEPTPTEKRLGRWEEPIRYAFFGRGVTSEDRRQMRELAIRLSRLTGQKIEPIAKEANFAIMYLDEDERSSFNEMSKDRWGEDFAEFNIRWASSWRNPCIGRLFYNKEGQINFGLIFIRNEIEGLFRQSCLHEEVVQTLGLTNDDEDVRPSIFNDDEEFAILTRHDEHLLQMLYDPRLSSGMSIEDVKPLLPQLAKDALANDRS